MQIADSARSSGLRRHYRPTPGKYSVRFLLLLSNHSAGAHRRRVERLEGFRADFFNLGHSKGHLLPSKVPRSIKLLRPQLAFAIADGTCAFLRHAALQNWICSQSRVVRRVIGMKSPHTWQTFTGEFSFRTAKLFSTVFNTSGPPQPAGTQPIHIRFLLIWIPHRPFRLRRIPA